jgi:hypothetical protein
VIVTAGSTNVTLYVYFVDDDGGTAPGEPTTGLLFSDIETGGSASYVRQGAARSDFTLVTTTVAAAHTDGGFVLVDDTNMPGLYRVDVPDAAFTTGADFVIIQLVAAAANNTIMRPLLVDILDVDLRDGVRGGMTALPNVAAGSAGGLPDDTDANGAVRVVDGTGAREINTNAGAIVTVETATATTTVNGLAANVITAASIATDAVTEMRSLVTGTTEAGGTTTTFVDTARTEADDYWIGAWVLFTSGSFANQMRQITDFDAASDTFTFSPALLGSPGAGETFEILSGVNVAPLVWDEVLSTATHNVASSAGRRLRVLEDSGGYLGHVWIDTVNGTAGTESFENGTDSNPSNTIANANTIAGNVNLTRFKVAAGSSITFAASQTNQVFDGSSWTLALGNQDIDGSTFIGADVSGLSTNTTGRQYFITCFLGAITVPDDTHFHNCGLSGTQTAGEAGDFFYDHCYSAIAGTGTPAFDFAAVGNNALSFRHYSGGIEIQNMAAGDTMSLEGEGQLVINVNCTGGTVAIRGNFTVTDNASGAVTLSEGARISDDKTFSTEALAGNPAESPTKEEALGYLYKTWRNKKDNDGSTLQIYDDAGSTVDHKATLSEAAGTVTHGEIVTGP